MPPFGQNLRRLIGVHDLRAREAGRLVAVSPQALSEWMRGKRQPNLAALLRVSRFFEVAPERLLEGDFVDLLENEVGDTARFRRVEAKIRRARRRAAGDARAEAKPR